MFEPYIVDDPLKSGARGAGIGVKKAAKIKIKVAESDTFSFTNVINGEKIDSGIGLTATKEFFNSTKIESNYKISVEQEIYIPIGSGFGSSAASAVSIIYGLSKLLHKNLSLIQIGQIAHISEVKSKTGLGTVAGLVCPGDIIIVKTPGPPGLCKLDKIILDEQYVIVAGSRGKMETAIALQDPNLVSRAREFGRKAVDALFDDPSIEKFFEMANWFARETKLSNPTIENAINACVNAGAKGAAQSMIGDAVFALVTPQKAEDVKRALTKALGVEAKIFEIANSPLEVVREEE